MKTKEAYQEAERICDCIEKLLAETPKKHRKDISCILCMTSATCVNLDDPFQPFAVLEQARIEISEMYGEVHLEILDEMLKKESNKNEE